MVDSIDITQSEYTYQVIHHLIFNNEILPLKMIT